MSFDIPKLRKARMLAGMTQTALAKKAGISARTISQMESGMLYGKPDTVKAIADVLGISMESLWLDEKEVA